MPRRRGLRRPVHRQHDEHGPGVPRPVAGRASTASRPRTRRKDEAARRGGRDWSWTSSGTTSGRRTFVHPRRRSTTRSPRSRRPAARRTASSTSSRSPTSSASPLDIDEFGADRRPDADRRRPPAGRPLHGHPPVRGRRPGARHARAAQRRPDRRRRAEGRRPDDRRDRARRRPRRPARTSSVPIERPIKPTGGLAILRGSLAPGRLRREAGRPRAAPAPRPGPRLRLRGRLLRGGPRPADRRRATSSSSATRARSAGPGCRRC